MMLLNCLDRTMNGTTILTKTFINRSYPMKHFILPLAALSFCFGVSAQAQPGSPKIQTSNGVETPWRAIEAGWRFARAKPKSFR
jgi:hypothetical protein